MKDTIHITNHHHHYHGCGPLEKLLVQVDSKLNLVLQKESAVMASLENLTKEVSEMAGVVDSAIVLINGLAQQIRDAGTDQAKLDELAASLDGKAGELGAAVAANSPAPTE